MLGGKLCLICGFLFFEVEALLLAPCLEFGEARLFGEAVRLLLFAAQPLFGRYPLYACSFRLRLLPVKYYPAVAFEISFNGKEHEHYGADGVADRLDPYVRYYRARFAAADQRVGYALSDGH